MTRDGEIKNKLTVSTVFLVGNYREGIMGGKWGGIFRNMYKGHMDKTKGG